MIYPKPKKVIDRKYKHWLAENYNCCLNGYGDVECLYHSGPPHHLPNENYLGKRRNRDDLQIPICLRHHRWLEDHKEEERKLLDKLYKIAKECWKAYKERI